MTTKYIQNLLDPKTKLNHNYMIVKRIKAEEKTESGIITMITEEQMHFSEKFYKGIILRTADMVTTCKVGDIVILSHAYPSVWEEGTEEYALIDEHSVIANFGQ